jgi:hypothetical protein
MIFLACSQVRLRALRIFKLTLAKIASAHPISPSTLHVVELLASANAGG